MESIERVTRSKVKIKNGKINKDNKTDIFTTWNNVKVKEEVSSDNDIIICEESNKMVNSTFDTQEVSTKFAYFKCDECNFKTIILANFVNHMKKHNIQLGELKDKYHKFKYSEDCQRKLAFNRLGKFMRICYGGKSFKCLLCESKFSEVSDLKAHMLDHDERGKNCKCDLCDEKNPFSNEVGNSNLDTQEVFSNTADSLKTTRNESENPDISNKDINLNISNRFEMIKDYGNEERVSHNQEAELIASDDWQTIQLGKNSENIEDDFGICNIAVKIVEDSDSEYETTEFANSREKDIYAEPLTETSHEEISVDYRNVYILSDNGEVVILGAPEKDITEVDLTDVTDKENLQQDEILSYDDSVGEIMSDYSDVEILGAPEKNVTVVDLIDVTEKEDNKQNVLERKKTLRKHKTVLSDTKFKCNLCSSSYKYKRGLKDHCLKSHSINTGEFVKQCAKCFDYFKTMKEYNDHYTKYHYFDCLECEKKFKYKDSLKNHVLKKHVKKCEECYKIFTSMKEYNDHYKKYHNFECLQCGRKFKSKRILKYHCSRQHSNDTSEYVKQCAECYENFKTIKDYNEHYRKYHPFQCLECEKKFISLTLLKQHYNEKCQKNVEAVIACSFCGKTFVNGIVYQNHMQQHLNLATKCEDTIRNKNYNLNYKCTMCKFSCIMAKDICHHIKFKHKTEGQLEGQLEKVLRVYKFEFDKIKSRETSNYFIT